MSISELRKAVEAGDLDAVLTALKPLRSAARDKGDFFPSHDIEKAFSGSLDAAKRLHDALLPGWTAVEIRSRGARTRWVVDLSRLVDEGEEFATGHDKDAARAYLLAILRALEEEGRG